MCIVYCIDPNFIVCEVCMEGFEKNGKTSGKKMHAKNLRKYILLLKLYFWKDTCIYILHERILPDGLRSLPKYKFIKITIINIIQISSCNTICVPHMDLPYA